MTVFKKISLVMILAATSIGSVPPAKAQETPQTPIETEAALMFRANHTALRVEDLDASVQVWKDVFGAREVRRSRVPDLDPGLEIVFLHLSSGFNIELVGGGSLDNIGILETIADDLQQVGYRHIGFMVANTDDALAHMAQFGIGVERRSVRPDYGIELAIIREPSGQFIELYAPLSVGVSSTDEY